MQQKEVYIPEPTLSPVENYSKEMLVSEILRQIPKGKVEMTEENNSDLRNYCVDFLAAIFYFMPYPING